MRDFLVQDGSGPQRAINKVIIDEHKYANGNGEMISGYGNLLIMNNVERKTKPKGDKKL
jgi:hypothetical protein